MYMSNIINIMYNDLVKGDTTAAAGSQQFKYPD